MFACNGILFNHESERRGHNFCTRKLQKVWVKYYLETTNKLLDGNIERTRLLEQCKRLRYGMWLIQCNKNYPMILF